MSSPVERMKKLLPCLPKKDITLAEKFINERDFESLREIVSSDIYKIAKKRRFDTSNLDLLKQESEMIALECLVVEYCKLLDPLDELIEDEVDDSSDEDNDY